MNYSLSGWIANLGVVPLLLFAFFLFVPALFNLSFLLLLVIVVLDAIKTSFKSLRMNFLANLGPFVKGVLIISYFYASHNGFCSDNADIIILSKGEQKELSLPFHKFSVGNPEVIATHSSEKGKILLKAKSIGFSDIAFWNNKTIKKINIFVIGKADFLKNIHLIDTLKDRGILLSFHGKFFTATGSLSTLEDWIFFAETKKHFKIESIVEINLKIKNDAITKIYEVLLKDGVHYVDCKIISSLIECEYGGSKLDPFIEAKLTKTYPVTFTHNSKTLNGSNLKLRFKIVQIEHYSKESLNLGLNKISSTLTKLLNSTTMGVVGNNEALFSGFNGDYELLSEPSQLVTIGDPNELQIGAEIPYLTHTQAGNDITEFKFAGVKVETLLESKYQKYFLKYKVSLTRPSENNSISGSKKSSQVYLNTDEYVELFELNYKASSIENEFMPILREIPLLGKLFSSNGKGAAYKQIIGFVKLEKEDE